MVGWLQPCSLGKKYWHASQVYVKGNIGNHKKRFPVSFDPGCEYFYQRKGCARQRGCSSSAQCGALTW
eukprot:964076-Prorocentrum_minimum.AAC.4